MDLAGSLAESLLEPGRGDLAIVGAASTVEAAITVDVATRDGASRAADGPTPGAEDLAAGTATVTPVGADEPSVAADKASAGVDAHLAEVDAATVEADMPSAAVGAATVEADMPLAAVDTATVEEVDAATEAADTVPMEAEAVMAAGAGNLRH